MRLGPVRVDLGDRNGRLACTQRHLLDAIDGGVSRPLPKAVLRARCARPALRERRVPPQALFCY